jgi:3-deoxy-7-phosphoheptulonate synthase
MNKLLDTHIRSMKPLVSPKALKDEIPLTEKARNTVLETRQEIEQIVHQKSGKILGLVGPCSIHDPKAALEYAEKLIRLQEDVEDQIKLVMRVYFEKPRTSIGWTGLVTDPDLDGSEDVFQGLHIARKLLIDINDMGMAAGTEVLDPIVPQYLADAVSWASIGARTTESQTHRHLASGLSMPVGFKNGTDGRVQTAVNALLSARHSHSFIGLDQNGTTCVIRTSGNKNSHIILRGGVDGPNFDQNTISEAEKVLDSEGIVPAIFVDCSHANSGKDYTKQPEVLANIVKLRQSGVKSLIGFMLESNLFGGSQKIPVHLGELRYGVSITDSCLGWTETERVIREAAENLAK